MKFLDITVPPAVEPVSIATAKTWLRVEVPDDDALIGALITAARQHCEAVTCRAFITQTLTWTLDGFPYGGGYYNRWIRESPTLNNYLPTHSGLIELPRPPFQAIDSISYLDANASTQTIDPSVYRVISGSESRTILATQPDQIWPVTYPMTGSVKIRFVAGYGDTGDSVPVGIQQAIQYMVGHWYEHRMAVSDVGMTEVPLGVDAMLTPFIWGGY